MVRQAVQLTGGVIAEVNVSAVTMGDPAACDETIELLAASPEAAARIVFEVTETASLVQLEAAQAFAQKVTSLGCKLALDDFGVVFGSLTYLRSLPLSYIKIDRSFVGRMAQSAED